jgi:RNA polymerase primary sigma factor
VQANMRLVVAAVKKLVTPQHSFDDLLSEGTASLLQAVEKFDYDRGFRFSTYAYRAITRNCYRKIMDWRKEQQRFAISEMAVDDAEDSGASGRMDEHTWERLRGLLAKLVSQLDRREQFVVRSRYGLGAHRRSRTFQDIADRLGISKERARQIEQRAVAKLCAMARKLDLASS